MKKEFKVRSELVTSLVKGQTEVKFKASYLC